MKTITLKEDAIHSGNLILVNAHYPCRDNTAERTLLPVNTGTDKILLDSDAVKHLACLMDRINGWEQITTVSGWRSMQEQTDIYTDSLKDNGKTFTEKFVAHPGHSEHQTGLAIDLALKQEHIDFICPDFPYTGICQTFRHDAVSYGFIERYPANKESITGIAHEPWHFRYVGVPHAEIMVNNDFVLEEYISFLKKYPRGKTHYFHKTENECITVSYLEANRTADTQFEIDDNNLYSVSGNNIDGFIITECLYSHRRFNESVKRNGTSIIICSTSPRH